MSEARLAERWREEKRSAWLYGVVAAREPDPGRRQMFAALGETAESQARILLDDIRKAGLAEPPPFRPDLRARVVAGLTRRLGPERARPLLAAMKVRGLSVYSGPPPTGHAMPVSIADVGERHRHAGAGGSLRAAVFGVNDGLVSNASLIMGVAGATSDSAVILTSGVAGLLAGAFSMGAGEYVSVRSQRELYEYQIAQERDELERYPEEEAEELALVYNARGVPMERAREMTGLMMKDKEQVLKTLAREELGLNPDDLGSPWGAATASFLAFAAGALVPLLPFLFGSAADRVFVAAVVSGLGLFAVGVALSFFSGRNAVLGGLRMLLIGGAAGLATHLIGRLLGVSLS
jgi:VIT1/CCC1 family predicted Fe2+/Mn2+ transporter